MWRQAARLGADRVAILPDSAQWLADYLACLHSPSSGAGVVGIVGGCGGAGASTLSLLVAAEAAARRDPDPAGRWGQVGWGPERGVVGAGRAGSALAGTAGRFRFHQPGAAGGRTSPSWARWRSSPGTQRGRRTQWLPSPCGSRPPRQACPRARNQFPDPAPAGSLSCRKPQSAVAEVMRAAEGAFGLVVVDVGRTPEALRTFADHCNGFWWWFRPGCGPLRLPWQMMETLPPMPVAAVVRGPVAEGPGCRHGGRCHRPAAGGGVSQPAGSGCSAWNPGGCRSCCAGAVCARLWPVSWSGWPGDTRTARRSAGQGTADECASRGTRDHSPQPVGRSIRGAGAGMDAELLDVVRRTVLAHAGSRDRPSGGGSRQGKRAAAGSRRIAGGHGEDHGRTQRPGALAGAGEGPCREGHLCQCARLRVA